MGDMGSHMFGWGLPHGEMDPTAWEDVDRGMGEWGIPHGGMRRGRSRDAAQGLSSLGLVYAGRSKNSRTGSMDFARLGSCTATADRSL